MYIDLSSDMVAIISDEDAGLVRRRKWSAARRKSGWYAVSRNTKEEGGKLVYLHRFIMGLDGPRVDHIDGNGLNCTRENMRHATQSQNMQNATIRSDNKSGYKGVTFDARKGMWRAKIRYLGKQVWIGYSSDPRNCALMYDGAARWLFGAFAKTNF